MKQTADVRINYKNNRLRTDCYLPVVQHILDGLMTEPAPLHLDWTEATDLTSIIGGIGVRVRDVRDIKYRAEFTIRITSGNGRSELDKIKDGHPNWIFYGFFDPASNQVVHWVLINCTVLRQVTNTPAWAACTTTRTNADATGFVAVNWVRLSGLYPELVLCRS